MPGLIAVDRDGARFANESLSYHDYGVEMLRNDADRKGTFGWIIADDTDAGLAVNTHSEVLDAADKPIPGLYAVGTAAVSVFCGGYPGYGANIGPALVFGYRAGRAAEACRAGTGHLFPTTSAYATAALVGIGAMAITTLTSLALARRRSSKTNP